jgi:hypothetical protein
MPPKKRQTNPPTWAARDVELDQICNSPGSGRGDAGDEQGSAGAEGSDDRTAARASVAALLDCSLEPLEDWVNGTQDSPDAENRYVEAAMALTNYAASLLERAASGIEATGETSAYAKRVRRSAGVLAQRAQWMADELVLVAECSCSEGCAACGFARGFAAVDLQGEGAQSDGESQHLSSGFFECRWARR